MFPFAVYRIVLNQLLLHCSLSCSRNPTTWPQGTEQKESAELDSLKLTGDFFKKIIVRMDIPHNFYDENGIFHCNLIDFLLERVELF